MLSYCHCSPLASLKRMASQLCWQKRHPKEVQNDVFREALIGFEKFFPGFGLSQALQSTQKESCLTCITLRHLKNVCHTNLQAPHNVKWSLARRSVSKTLCFSKQLRWSKNLVPLHGKFSISTTSRHANNLDFTDVAIRIAAKPQQFHQITSASSNGWFCNMEVLPQSSPDSNASDSSTTMHHASLALKMLRHPRANSRQDPKGAHRSVSTIWVLSIFYCQGSAAAWDTQ